MNLKKILVASILTVAVSAPVLAKQTGEQLATPIVKLIPAFKEIREELKLNDEQAKTIDAWIAEAPAKKKEVIQKVFAVRAELREAILNRDDRAKRDALKKKLNNANNRLVVMSSLCTRMLHKTLTKEQYAKVIAQYKK
ncbi:MAG TPA: hypothetical protein EYH16_02845 [Leucothrix mucor]|nr:hypothetical protein [Leucothrix mucor]